MKITALETVRLAERPNLIWVQVHTDAGIAGLGETFFGAGAVGLATTATAQDDALRLQSSSIPKHRMRLLQASLTAISPTPLIS